MSVDYSWRGWVNCVEDAACWMTEEKWKPFLEEHPVLVAVDLEMDTVRGYPQCFPLLELWRPEREAFRVNHSNSRA